MMLVTWALLVIPVATCQEVYESTEDLPAIFNVTTLYPVANKTVEDSKVQRNSTELHDSYRNKISEKENYEGNSQEKDTKTKGTETGDEQKGGEKILEAVLPRNVSAWKIDATYLPKATKNVDANSTDSKEEIIIKGPLKDEKEFKPSPHLGSFFDDDNINLLKFSTQHVVPGKKPTLDFLGSKDLYALNYKSPKDTYRNQIDAPYRFETSYFPKTSNWKQALDSKPTVEVPIKIPAGGLYKHSDPFKDKPSFNGDDEEFGLSFSEDGKGKENPLKKRSNPWKHLLQLVTAFLPVGLIISALTPNVITIHSTDNDPYLNRFSRRADEGVADIPAISERCKRRLLCEIHSDENYIRSQDKSSGYVRKHCYKLRCEDPQALNRVLRWLLAHHPKPTTNPPRLQQPYHPGSTHPGPAQQPYRPSTIHQSHSVIFHGFN